MKCFCSQNCFKEFDDISANINDFYSPCVDCNIIELKKATPLKRQLNLDDLDSDYAKCPSCGRRSLDIVLSHVIKILINQGILKESLASLRRVGIPLITPGIIVDEVHEVKGVIRGNPKLTIGQLDSNSEIEEYKLLAGCDVRVDILNTSVADIVIYKQQSKLHIEFPRKNQGKINQVQEILNKYDNPRIIDGMCGPGTLGIYGLKSNASFVLFNDIYKKAVETTEFNLKINQIPEDKYSIYNEDLNDLVNLIDEKYDIGIIDAFPGVNIDSFRENLLKICKEVIFV